MSVVLDSFFFFLKLHIWQISKFCHCLFSQHTESDPLLPSVSLPQSNTGHLPLALELLLPNLQLDSMFLPLSPWQCICHIGAIVTLFKNWSSHVTPKDFPIAQTVKKISLQCRRPRFDPWVRKIPWRREWQPTPVFLPGEFHRQRSLVGYRVRRAKSRTWLSD